MFLMLRMCVYMHSRFVENHRIRILEDWPSFLRWFCPILHTPKLVFHWNVALMSHVHYFLWLAQILWVCFSETMWTSTTYFFALPWQVTCHWRITNNHKNGFETKVLTLVLIPDLHSVVAPHLLQIFNQRPEISVDVIPRVLWPRYQYWHHNIFPFVGQPRRKVQNRQHNWLG
jgi:hypothetical protein